jgi:hypothetical protein
VKNQSKIMITVLTPVLSRLNTKIEKLMLRRDSYLNSVLSLEIEYLEKEIRDRNSDQARDYLLSQLKAMPTKSMSIALDKKLITRIDTVCKKINVARDCWINRILFFLAAEKAQLNAIGITAPPHESLSTNPLDAASELIFDPIFDCRDWIEKNSSSFYKWDLRNQLLVGMACYISDSDLPSTSCPEVDLLEALGASPNYGKDITCN